MPRCSDCHLDPAEPLDSFCRRCREARATGRCSNCHGATTQEDLDGICQPCRQRGVRPVSQCDICRTVLRGTTDRLCPGCMGQLVHRPQSRCLDCGTFFREDLGEAHDLCRACYAARHLGEGVGDLRTDPPFSLSKKLGPKPLPSAKKAPPPVRSLWERLAQEDPLSPPSDASTRQPGAASPRSHANPAPADASPSPRGINAYSEPGMYLTIERPTPDERALRVWRDRPAKRALFDSYATAIVQPDGRSVRVSKDMLGSKHGRIIPLAEFLEYAYLPL